MSKSMALGHITKSTTIALASSAFLFQQKPALSHALNNYQYHSTRSRFTTLTHSQRPQLPRAASHTHNPPPPAHIIPSKMQSSSSTPPTTTTPIPTTPSTTATSMTSMTGETISTGHSSVITATTDSSSALSQTTTTNSLSLPTEVQTLKKNLRRRIRTSLQTLTPTELSHQSSSVWTKLFCLPEYQTARNVGLFLSMPSGEIDTRPACRRVLRDGKGLYVPRVGLDFENPSMEMTLVEVSGGGWSDDDSGAMPYDTWPRNRWGIPEAPLSTNTDSDSSTSYPIAKPGDIDMLVVPGLAFDRFGSRLGQGKGYYDRFITAISTTTTSTTTAAAGGGDVMTTTTRRPLLVAVGLEPSFVEGDDRVPMAEYDVVMDRLIVPHRETFVFDR